MITQLTMLFPGLFTQSMPVKDKHVHWMQLANAGDYHEKKYRFYPFKTRFLRRFAVPDGLDLQTIVRKCWCGDGIWRGIDYNVPKQFWQPCNRCGGTGIYDKRRIVLIRWLLNGVLFHEPSTLIMASEHHEYKNRITGLIKHEGVSPEAGRRAMLKLFLRYEPQQFELYWMDWWRTLRDARVNRAIWYGRARIAHVKKLLGLVEPGDDVPF